MLFESSVLTPEVNSARRQTLLPPGDQGGPQELWRRAFEHDGEYQNVDCEGTAEPCHLATSNSRLDRSKHFKVTIARDGLHSLRSLSLAGGRR